MIDGVHFIPEVKGNDTVLHLVKDGKIIDSTWYISKTRFSGENESAAIDELLTRNGLTEEDIKAPLYLSPGDITYDIHITNYH